MFGIGAAEFIIILLVALIVVGPERLPDLARSAGKTVNDLRRMYTNLRSQLGPDFDEIEQQVRALRSLDPRREMNTIGKRVLDGLSDDIGPEVQEALRPPTFTNLAVPTDQPMPSIAPPAANGTASRDALDATRQRVEQLSHNVLNDELLDEPLAGQPEGSSVDGVRS